MAILGDRGNGEGIGDSSVGGSANDINTGSTCHRIMTADGSGAMLVWDARTGQILLRESVDPAQTQPNLRCNQVRAAAALKCQMAVLAPMTADEACAAGQPAWFGTTPAIWCVERILLGRFSRKF